MAATVSDPVLDDIVARVTAAVAPRSIILFGSRARGDNRPDSDYDILVLKDPPFDFWETMSAMRRGLRGLNAAVDLVLATPEEAERHRDSWASVYEPALREGVELLRG